MRPLTGARTLSVVSGGQSGVDRAALDAALSLESSVGGWCPKARWSEDGPLPGRYPLRETESPDPDVRTAANVRDSDATLVVIAATSDAGIDRTVEAAQRGQALPHRRSCERTARPRRGGCVARRRAAARPQRRGTAGIERARNLRPHRAVPIGCPSARRDRRRSSPVFRALACRSAEAH